MYHIKTPREYISESSLPFIHPGLRLLKKKDSKGDSLSFIMKFKSSPHGPRDTFSMGIKEKADMHCLASLKWLSTQFLTLSLNGAPALGNSVFQRALCFTFHRGMKSSITFVVLQLMNLCSLRKVLYISLEGQFRLKASCISLNIFITH